MSEQRLEFQDRIARMSADKNAHRNSNGKIKQNYKANLGYAMTFVWAFLSGVASVILVRLVVHHMVGPVAIEDLSLAELAMNAVFAGVIILAIRMATKLNGKEHLTCQAAGLMVAFTGFHNLSHWAPEPMAALFTPEFVVQTQAITYPNTLKYRGMTFYFGPKPDQKVLSNGGQAHERRHNKTGTDFTPRGGGAFVSRL